MDWTPVPQLEAVIVGLERIISSFKRLTEVDKFDFIEMMNHPSLKRHMPLLSAEFTEDDCKKLIEAKEQLWADHGYGPWAFVVDGKFAYEPLYLSF